jgi:hypothetical protein
MEISMAQKQKVRRSEGRCNARKSEGKKMRRLVKSSKTKLFSVYFHGI